MTPLIRSCFVASWVLFNAAAQAQPASSVPALTSAPALKGHTFEGAPFNLTSLKGKVVLLMFWSTSCAVCRDKMPELRQNYAGWIGKPFEMVLVNTDRDMADVKAYEAIVSRTVPLTQRFVQLWAGDANFSDGFGKPGQLPATFLIDKAGRVVDRWHGRVPPETWDKIADLL